MINDSTYQEGFREDDYEVKQILLNSIIADIQLTSIIEIWQVKPELLPTHFQFVILLKDGSHFCTCNLLISYGIPCRHFFKVIQKSPNCRFHITLINQRWYNEEKFGSFNQENQEANLQKIIILVKSTDSNITTNMNSFSFNYLNQAHGEQVFTSKLQKIVSSKAKYGKALGLAKKVLDVAQKLDCFNEVYGMFQAFIDEKQIRMLQEVQNTESIGLIEQQSNAADLSTFGLIEQQSNAANLSTIEHNIICTNPLTSKRHGRPPK